MAVRTTVFDIAPAYGYTSLRKLAKAMGVSVATLSRVQSGKRGINNNFITGACNAFPDKGIDELFVRSDCALSVA